MDDSFQIVLVATPETAHVSLGVRATTSAPLLFKFSTCCLASGILFLAAKYVHIDLTLLSFSRFAVAKGSQRLFITTSFILIVSSDPRVTIQLGDFTPCGYRLSRNHRTIHPLYAFFTGCGIIYPANILTVVVRLRVFFFTIFSPGPTSGTLACLIFLMLITTEVFVTHGLASDASQS